MMRLGSRTLIALMVVFFTVVVMYFAEVSYPQDLHFNIPLEISTDVLLRDSFSIKEYYIYLYYFPADKFDSDGLQYFIYQNNTFLLASPRCFFTDLDRRALIKNPRDFSDVNGDGLRDVVFICGSGGNAGAEDAYIVTLDSSASAVGAF